MKEVTEMKTYPSLLRGSAIALLLVALLLAACSAWRQGTEGGDSGDQTPTPGLAGVESIEIMLLESFPVQVNVVVRGNLPDSCTEIAEIDQGTDLEDETFWVEITTVRTTDEPCAQVLVPFQESVPVDVQGLPAGTYTVDVNGVEGTFTLEVDNVLDTGLPNPASAYCEDQGYRLEVRTDEEGNQYGVCIFSDGSECDEWAFYRGECGPATPSTDQ
jgi:inhibitor of cysteine peptidase